MKNYLTLSAEELTKPIYRIFSIDYLLELLSTNDLVLVKPKLWDDPFENLILKSLIQNDKTKSNSYRDNIFAQCWTQHRETDAMWRIYSPNKDGVKIKSTPKKLFDSIYNSTSCEKVVGTETCFIGKVQYINQSDLIAELEKKPNSLYDTTGKAMSLLIKRREFRHEREVRLIHIDLTDERNADTKKIQIDAFNLFEEITFDPRLSDLRYKALKNYIISLGYDGKISKSRLYKVPVIQWP